MTGRKSFLKGSWVIIAMVVLGALFGSFSCSSYSKCSDDTDCAKGEICLLDVCLVGCRASTECPQGRFCVDFKCVTEECKAGAARTCYGGDARTLGQGLCRGGIQFCTDDGRWSTCSGQFLPQKEICDRLDNDCNGKVDDGISCGCESPGNKRSCFPGDSTLAQTGACLAGIQYCENNNQWGVCLGYNLPQAELCDGIDNDCDGKVDDGVSCGCQDGDSRRCYTGPSGTLHAPCKEGVQTCKSNTWGVCQGEVLPTPERCGDGIDNNCDGRVDDADAQGPCPGEPGREPAPDATEPTPDATEPIPEVPDASPRTPCPSGPPPALCQFTGNHLDNQGTLSCVGGAPVCQGGYWQQQCNTADARVDGAKESCNGFDDDCNGLIDDGVPCPASRFCAGTLPCVRTLAGLPNYWHSGKVGTNNPFFMWPNGLAVEQIDPKDPIFFVYVSDALRHRISKVYFNRKTKTSRLSLLAGAGRPGFKNGVGATALFNQPNGMALGPNGNLFVADTGNHCIRQIDKNGLVSTFVGRCGQAGYMNGDATVARFLLPHAIVFDGFKMYIADTGNHRIRVITDINKPVVSLFAGNGVAGYLDGASQSAEFREPVALAVDPNGGQSLVIVAERGNRVIRAISTSSVSTISGVCAPNNCAGGFQTASTGSGTQYRRPLALAVDQRNGNVYVADGGNHAILILRKGTGGSYSSDVLVGGGPSNGEGQPGYLDLERTAARLRNPTTVALAGGRLFFSGLGNQRLRSFAIDGSDPISFAGSPNSGPTKTSTDADSARFSYPAGVIALGVGSALIADSYNRVLRKVEQGKVTTLNNKSTGLPFAFAEPRGMALSGLTLYVADKEGHQIKVLDLANLTLTYTIGSGVEGQQDGKSLKLVEFSLPSDVALGKDDTLFIADTGNKSIRMGTRAGVGQPINAIAKVAVSGDCASFWGPTHLAWSAKSQVLYVLDKEKNTQGDVLKTRVCALSPTGSVTDYASTDFLKFSVQLASAIATSDNGDLYVAFSHNNAIHKYDSSGRLLWITASSETGGYFDGILSHASFFHPLGLAHGPDGLLVADTGNHRIRVIYEK